MTKKTAEWDQLAESWRNAVTARLAPGEVVMALFEHDLDAGLNFGSGLVVLTSERILTSAGKGDGVGDWTSWPFTASLSLSCVENGATGSLDLADGDGRLARWRYTVGRAPLARRFAQRWEQREQSETKPAPSICPSCGAVMADASEACESCAPETGRPSLSSLTRLLVFARPHAAAITFGFLLTLAGTTAGLVPPYLTMPLLDRVLIPYQEGKDADFSLVAWYLSGLGAAAVLAWILEWARAFVSARVSERISGDLRLRTYAHLQQLSLEFFGGKRTGDLMSRISSDTDRLCTFLSTSLVDFLTDVLMITLTAIVLLAIDPILAAATLVPFPLIVWLVYRVRGKLLGIYRHGNVAWAEMTSILADTIPGVRVVKAFAQESREVDRFDNSNTRVLAANDRVNRTWAYFGPTVSLLTTTGLLIVWAFASWQVYRHRITVGVLTAFLAYITRFYSRSESMLRIFSTAQRAAASAQRVLEILDRKPSVVEATKPQQPGRLTGSIELRGVRFRYGAREVLHGLDLRIEPGEMIGLVGPSGAGKSTLMNLMCRFYDPAAGVVLVDGVDIRSFPVEAYRRNIGVVLQDPFLFYGTVAENIAYGRPQATRREIVAAARAARAHDFILRLPGAYDALVGERGQSLSGGERQRISIARALLTDPRILLLDEATSSVDTETERHIQAALETLVKGRTTVAIAHRLSTLARADRLVVLERGRIVEVGTHADLLARDGSYARLHRSQQQQAAQNAMI